ncbi:MAG: hypothetical protein WCO93_07295 [bacterium]
MRILNTIERGTNIAFTVVMILTLIGLLVMIRWYPELLGQISGAIFKGFKSVNP